MPIPNKYPGPCHYCGQWVEAEAGVRLHLGEQWVTAHADCIPTPVAPSTGDHDGWHRRPLAALDFEATGRYPRTDRIVSAAICHSDGRTESWLVDPGIDIPERSTAIHGITTEQVRAHGRPTAEFLPEFTARLAALAASGTPLVVFHAQYDLTLLDELARHAPPSTATPATATPATPEGLVVIDPLVLDRHIDRYRPGSRRLPDLCVFYGVPHNDAHTAVGDAMAALALAQAIAARHPDLAAMTPADLHAAQTTWHAEQEVRFQGGRRRQTPA